MYCLSMTPLKTQTGKTSVFTTHLSHCCVVRCGTSFSHKCYQHELEARLTKLLPVSWDVSIFCDSFICSLSQIRSLSLHLFTRTHAHTHACTRTLFFRSTVWKKKWDRIHTKESIVGTPAASLLWNTIPVVGEIIGLELGLYYLFHIDWNWEFCLCN